jgi:hypothetical protein
MRTLAVPADASQVLLCIARILAVAILFVWGFFCVAHLLGDAGTADRALVPRDYGILVAMVSSLVGLGLALKWERLGAILTLAAVAVGAMLNWKVLLFPGILIPLAALLFLLHSHWRSSARPTPNPTST